MIFIVVVLLHAMKVHFAHHITHQCRMTMSSYLTLPHECHHPGCQCLHFTGTKTHDRMTCVKYFHAIEDHYEVGINNNVNNLQTCTPIAHCNDEVINSDNKSVQHASPPIASIECKNSHNSTASNALSSEISHHNDNSSINSKTFSTPQHDASYLLHVKNHTSKIVRLEPPTNNNVAILHDEMHRGMKRKGRKKKEQTTGTTCVHPHEGFTRHTNQQLNNEAQQGWVGKLTFDKNGIEPHLLIRKFVQNQINEETIQPNKIPLWHYAKKSTNDESCLKLISDFINCDEMHKKFTSNKTKNGPTLHIATKTS